jgi:hypothetical protein
MPQPFVFKHGTLRFGREALDGRHGLVAMIGLVAVHWANLEYMLSRIFTTLIGGKQDVAFEIYHMLIDRELRNKTFLAAASVSGLPKDIVEDAETLFKDIRKGAGERNAIVHGIWASVDGEENYILLLDQKAVNNVLFKDIYNFSSKEFMNVKYQKYKDKDFNATIDRIILLSEKANQLYAKIFMHTTTPA